MSILTVGSYNIFPYNRSVCTLNNPSPYKMSGKNHSQHSDAVHVTFNAGNRIK